MVELAQVQMALVLPAVQVLLERAAKLVPKLVVLPPVELARLASVPSKWWLRLVLLLRAELWLPAWVMLPRAA